MNQLVSATRWNPRGRISKGKIFVDKNSEELGFWETEDTNNFKSREIIKECTVLIDEKQERIFDTCYTNGDFDEHPFDKKNNYLFKVMSVGYFFQLLVRRKKDDEWIEMPYKRTIPDAIPYGSVDAELAINRIFDFLNINGESGEPITGKTSETTVSALSTHEINLRFPYDKLRNKKTLSNVEKELHKLQKNRKNIPDNYKKIVDLWLPMIKLMRKKEGVK